MAYTCVWGGGEAGGSQVLSENRIYITSKETKNLNYVITCRNVQTVSEVWERSLNFHHS